MKRRRKPLAFGVSGRFLVALLVVGMFLVSVSVSACKSEWPPETPAWLYVELTVFGQVKQSSILLTGRNNLPAGAVLACVIERRDDSGLYLTRREVTCHSSRYDVELPAPGWPPGPVTATVTFDPSVGQPAGVRHQCGDAGQYLAGPHVVELGSTRAARVTTTLTLPGPASSESSELDSVPATVYITGTGTVYHRTGCKHLRRSIIPIGLEDAKAGGFTPCPRCRPPN